MIKQTSAIALAAIFVSFTSVVSARGNSENAKEIRINKEEDRLKVTTTTEVEDYEDSKSFNGSSVVKFESKAGVSKVFIKSEDEETELEISLEDNYEVEIGDQASDSGNIKISKKGDSFSLESKGIRTRTNFPLTVNPDTNELIISTPAGQKTVILPSVAIQNMINKAGFDVVKLEMNDEDDATGSAELEDSTESAELYETDNELLLIVDEDGNLVYEAEGIDRQRFLGLLPVGIRKKVRVDAETGAIISIDSPIFQRILDVLSF